MGIRAGVVYSFSVLKRKIISIKEKAFLDKEFHRSPATSFDWLVFFFTTENREGYLDKPLCHLYLPHILHDYDCPPKPVIVDIGKSKEGKLPIWPLFTCDCKCQSELGGEDSSMDLLAQISFSWEKENVYNKHSMVSILVLCECISLFPEE